MEQQAPQIITRYSQATTNQQRCLLCLRAFLKALPYLLLYFFVPALCLSLGYVLFNSNMDSHEFFIYGSNFYTFVGIVFSLWFLRRRAKKNKLDLVSGWPEHWTAITVEKSLLFFFFGLTVALSLSSLLTVLGKIPFLAWLMSGYQTASTLSYAGYDLLFCIIITVLLGPLVEEVIFRGYILDTLLETFEERTCILISTIGFALCHINGLWMVYAAGMGFLLVYTALREDGIFYPVLCHIGFNLPSAVIYVLNDSVPSSQAILSNIWFLLALLCLCGLAAFYMGRHYYNQSAGSYQSIWRSTP